MYPVLLVAAVAILSGVVVVAMGRGGEMTLFRGDVAEFRFRIRTPADVEMLRLPIGLLGYRETAASDALRAIAGLLAERDAEIAMLRDRLKLLDGPGPAAPVLLDGPGPAAPALPSAPTAPEPGMEAARPAVPS